jgi:hypothetical protein
MRAETIALGMLVIVVTSCGSAANGPSDGGGNLDTTPDSPGADTPPITAESACVAYSAAYCQKQKECAPEVFASAYGSSEVCIRQTRYLCPWTFVPGSGDSPTVTSNCAATISAASCANFNHNEACTLARGTLANGSPCQLDLQCDSGRCSRPADPSCGVCRAPSAKGDPCSDSDACGGDGLACDFSTNSSVCKAVRKAGESCADTLDLCEFQSFCNPQGMCESTKAAGAPCASTDQCQWEIGLVCLSDSRCGPWRLVGRGETCDGNDVSCLGGSVCNLTTMKCEAYALDGQPCTPPDNSAGCEFGLTCVAGKCAVRTALVCN